MHILLALSLLQQPDPVIFRFWPSQLALVADWSQTMEIARRPERWHEHNPILGRHPSPAKVTAYFALATVGNIALSRLPTKSRRIARGALLAVELGNVIRNRAVGIRFGSPF